MSLTLIVAATLTHGIGHGGQLPWKLAREMAYFKRVTTTAPADTQNLVLMGRHTWESIPARFRPLADRVNIILSTRAAELTYAKPPAQPAILTKSVEVALAVEAGVNVHKRFLIGGAQLYQQCLDSGLVERILLTRILSPAFEQCDVLLPVLGTLAQDGWTQVPHEKLEEWVGFEVPSGVQEENGVQYEFQMWVRAT
ncbi:hypothetical protein AURDEDRAFT_50760 [Auricularia subglabra TFB-10046 SS5]|nr:hypothetical protein AURDEDRAFT_50760 [Auricularia subglabra TFB-10046 SS5]